MQKWTKREINYLVKHYPLMPTPVLAEKLGYSESAVKTKAGKLGIKKLIHSNNPYTPEKLAKLKELYPNTRNVDIAKILGVSEGSVISAGSRYKLRKTPEFLRKCSEKGYYKKGQEPANKGRKMNEWMSKEGMKNCKKTRFKKGQMPVNHKEVGSERVCSKDGYIYVKVAEPNKWELKHRVIYRQHFGAIPKGRNVEFKDRNKLNLDPSNLVLRSRNENMKLNSLHNYPKEIANAIQLIGALNRQINKRKV